MKKLLILFIFLNIVLTGTRIFIDYGLSLETDLLADKSKFSISLLSGEDKGEPGSWSFQDFSDMLTKANIDFLCFGESYNGKRLENNYYTNSLENDFLHIPLSQGHAIDSSTFFSTGHRDVAYPIYGISFNNEVNIWPIGQIKDIAWSEGIYYVDQAKAGDLQTVLAPYPLSVTEVASLTMHEVAIVSFLNTAQVVLLVFFAVACLVFAVSKQKAFALLKLSGYSGFQILTLELRSFVLSLGMAVVCVLGSLLIVITILAPGSAYYFCLFSFKSLLYTMGYLLLLFGGILIGTVILTNYQAVRGNTKTLEVYVFCLVIKVALLVVLLFSLIMGSSALPQIFQTYQGIKTMGDTISDYYRFDFTFAGQNMMMSKEEWEKLDAKAEKLIRLTEDAFEGIIVDSDCYGNWNRQSQIFDKSIGINRNYLYLNPIYGLDGKRILPESIPSDKYVMLLPEGGDEQIWRSSMQYGYDWTDETTQSQLVFIHYSTNSKIYSYNERILVGGDGLLPNPPMLLLSEDFKFASTSPASYFTGQGDYMVRVKDGDPFKVLAPYIREAGLERNIIKMTSLSSAFDQQIKSAYNQLLIMGILAIMTICLFVIMTYYEVSVYFSVMKQRIALKRIFGYDFGHIYWSGLLVRCVSYVAIVVVSVIIASNRMAGDRMALLFCVGFPMLLSLFDIMIFLSLGRRQERRKIGETLKGG